MYGYTRVVTGYTDTEMTVGESIASVLHELFRLARWRALGRLCMLPRP